MPTLHPLSALATVLALLLPVAARAEQLLELELSAPPHAPADAPDVMVHVPSRFSVTQPVELLIFLHGFSCCTRALLATEKTACTRGGALQHGYGLAALHERAHGNTLLVVPQLAFLQRRAGSPRFDRAGGFDAFLKDLLARLRSPLGASPAVAGITLLAHSAGYKSAAQILRDRASVNIPNGLVLFDALYANWDIFAHWLGAAPGRRLISLYTRDAQTRLGNRQLQQALRQAARGAGGEATRHSLDARLLVAEVPTAHRLVPARHLLPTLRALFVTRDLQDALPGAVRPSASVP